jgi:threonyl-tRNA synthetase
MLLSLRHLAAKILAAAVKELFPEALLIEGRGTSRGFYYDFLFPFKFQPELLIPLEEKMRFIIKEKRRIKILEMIPSNAASFLLHHGQEIPAEKVSRKKDPLVQIFQMGSFIDFLEVESLGEIDQLKALRLQEILSEGKVTRLVGTAFTEKEQLKEFLKKEKVFGLSHLELGEQLKLFVWKDGEILWCPNGEKLRERLLDLLKKEYDANGFERVATYAPIQEMFERHHTLHTRCNFSKTAEISLQYPDLDTEAYESERRGIRTLFEHLPCSTDRAYTFYQEKNLLAELISSLQFIVKIPKILGFEYEVVLAIPQKAKTRKGKERELLTQALSACHVELKGIEVRRIDRPLLELGIHDGLGRKWASAFVELDLMKKVIVQAAFTSVECFLALLLERYQGEFPFWLASEQVRIISLGDQKEEAVRLQSALASSGFRVSSDGSSESLGRRMHRALLERIPFVVCLGEREMKNRQVTVRIYGSKKEESMSAGELMELLKKEMGKR